jgi:hypothetical protein
VTTTFATTAAKPANQTHLDRKTYENLVTLRKELLAPSLVLQYVLSLLAYLRLECLPLRRCLHFRCFEKE